LAPHYEGIDDGWFPKLTCASKALNPPGPRQSIFNRINIIGVDPPINKTLQKTHPITYIVIRSNEHLNACCMMD
jgi:hypothetical protein